MPADMWCNCCGCMTLSAARVHLSRGSLGRWHHLSPEQEGECEGDRKRLRPADHSCDVCCAEGLAESDLRPDEVFVLR